jgi:hypothetical protein
MGLDSNALITLAALKAYLGPDIPADSDAVLETLINQASALVRTSLDRELIQTTYTNLLLDGPDSEYLYLPDWPTSELTGVYEDDVLLIEGTDYKVYPARGYLRRLNGKWSEGSQNIKVSSHKGGYLITDIPRDIQALVMNKVAKEWQKQKGSMWGQTSRNLGDGSMNFEFDLAFSEDEIKILVPHMRLLL